jgi:hypothetical protein
MVICLSTKRRQYRTMPLSIDTRDPPHLQHLGSSPHDPFLALMAGIRAEYILLDIRAQAETEKHLARSGFIQTTSRTEH